MGDCALQYDADAPAFRACEPQFGDFARAAQAATTDPCKTVKCLWCTHCEPAGLDKVDILRRIPLFSNIDPAKLKLMAFASERILAAVTATDSYSACATSSNPRANR